MSNDGCLVLNTDGKLFSWGQGTVGHGNMGLTPVPQVIETFSGQTVTDIAAGTKHFLCTCSEGHLYSWGDDVMALGHGEGITSLATPTAIQACFGTKFVRVECTNTNSFALTLDGTVYGWGSDKNRLGTGGDGRLPMVLRGLPEKGVVDIYCGMTHCAAKSENAQLFMWGSNRSGESDPDNMETVEIAIPRIVNFASSTSSCKLQKAALGNEFTLALTEDGSVFSWGKNEVGQLGHGNCRSPCHARQIQALQHRLIVDISASTSMASARCEIGTQSNTKGTSSSLSSTLFTWGQNNQRQLFHPDNQLTTIPRMVDPVIDVNPQHRRVLSDIIFPRAHGFPLVVLRANRKIDFKDETSAVVADLMKLFNEKDFADTLIRVDGREIHVCRVSVYSVLSTIYLCIRAVANHSYYRLRTCFKYV